MRSARPTAAGAATLAWGLRLGLFVFCAFPLYWMVVSSFKASPELLASPPTFFPHEWELRAYRKLFYETNFWTYFQNTVVVAGLTTLLVLVAGTIGAYSLTRYRYPGRAAVARTMLLAYMFPPIILMVPLFLLARNLGLTNSRIGLALTYISFALPYALWILRAFFQSIPLDLEHAALIDGANRAQALLHVVAPLALPGMIATAIFTFIVAWNDFLFALVLIGVDELKTLPVGVNDFFHMAVVDWGLIMAAGVMVTIPALVFFIAVQRYLIAGWGAGGLKG
ncbi:MAG TPA: carbohydrate ABC transporter permease [Methylomirabilota bacterium]|jgi:ABC-type glycerol-3-phosphate transport system permease component|nr:carbohydrate ABC transporter permease [Methylomirabilota bacterium]